MTSPARAMLGVALPVLTIAVFVILLAFSLTRLSRIEQDMRIDATENMLWVISRAHVASLQLSGAAENETDPAELALRHKVFLSRLRLLDDGPQRRQMQALGFGDALDEFRGALPELRALLAPDGTPDPGRVRAILRPYDTMLGQAANNAMVAEWDDLGRKLDTSREQLWQITISLIGISLAGAALCAHFLLAIRDARRRTRLLNKEKAFSELLIGSSGEAIVAVDLDRRCTLWNDAAARLFDLPSTRTIGQTLDDVSGFFQVDRIDDAIGHALAGQPAALFDQPFFRAGQPQPLYVDLRCFSLRDGARIVGSILLVSDVTARRDAQKEIADHRDHLEHLVQARTQELDAALTRERETADLYRNFGTMISHQFRTPLAIVDSALQRLMRRSGRLSADEVLERGAKARRAIARLTRLVESTLDAARLDAGQIEIRSRPCDLGQLATEICARQTEQAPDRAITVELPRGDAALAYCDPAHAEHILVNLLSNAVKYSPEQTPILVTVSAIDDRVECDVQNQSGPICPVDQNALFERYFRGRNAEGRQGIGIGLYMARTLARLQNGDVRLTLADAHRITFTLTLPLARATLDDAASSTLLSEPA